MNCLTAYQTLPWLARLPNQPMALVRTLDPPAMSPLPCPLGYCGYMSELKVLLLIWGMEVWRVKLTHQLKCRPRP
ncbi:hypothetical protein TNCV_3277161 [Trichonephila clavipes]|nr:hypothetical protein TNCV_3277161 [Trichonephila clavipes]